MQLTIQGLAKTYPNGTRALRDICLTIHPGMFGLLGPNGAGKSTLMRTLATLQEVDAGTVDFNGVDALTEKASMRRLLGYLPQEFGLDPKVKAIDMLDHFAALKGIADRRERRRSVEDLLRQTNLWEFRNERLGTYSGGMKQRFGIAQALIGDPQLLIVDEPTAGLDPAERSRFLNLLAGIGESVVVVLSTHIVDDISQLCTDMAILHEGSVRLNASPQSAIERLQGKVWEKAVSRAELEETRSRWQVLSTRLLGGTHRVRVYAEEPPGPGFSPVTPILDDVYFLAIGDAKADSHPASGFGAGDTSCAG